MKIKWYQQLIVNYTICFTLQDKQNEMLAKYYSDLFDFFYYFFLVSISLHSFCVDDCRNTVYCDWKPKYQPKK